jgi:pimeloyl-ACP methyl ester carboxylesterase
MHRPPLILLHGALGSKAQFESWLPLLERAFRVHTLDFEGHGSQPFADRPFAIAHFADNLEAYITANDLAPAHVFGYSMGGYVALYLARRKPALLGRIFTFATKLDWNPETAAREAKMLDVHTILEKVPRFAQSLEARHFGNDWKQHLAHTADMMRALGAAPALTGDDFAALNLPVRMGLGDRDTMVSLEETVAAYRKLPQGQLFVMPGTPHPIEKIDPLLMCREIETYLGNAIR